MSANFVITVTCYSVFFVCLIFGTLCSTTIQWMVITLPYWQYGTKTTLSRAGKLLGFRFSKKSQKSKFTFCAIFSGHNCDL